MHLVFMLTENYVPRARPFVESLSRLSGIKRVVICLGFQPIIWLGAGIDHVTMPRHWSESSLGIMQQGRWLDALPDVRDDEVYLLTDADLVIQRDFTPEERQRFESCGENGFLAGWNAVVGDSLYDEALRLDANAGAIDDLFGSRREWGGIPCYNTGVLAMRGRSWKRLRDLYESRCERFYKLTSHRSRGQWLMCWCLHRLRLQADILPLTVHAHAHFGIPAGVVIHDEIAYYGDEVCIRDEPAYYRDKVILFRHAF